MRSLAVLPPLAACALLGACALGPNYRPPPLPQLPVLAAGHTSDRPPDPTWWRLYGDADLDRAVDRAVARNTDLRAADANLAGAEAAIAAARAVLMPTATVTGNWNYGESPAAIGEAAGTGRRPAPGGFVSASLGLSADLDLFGRARRAIEAARGDAAATAAARDQVRDTIVAATVRAYLDACAQTAALAVGERAVATAADVSQRTERLRVLGGAAVFDVERARALESQSRAALSPLQAGRRTAELEVAALEGDAVETGAPACATTPKLQGPIAAGDAAALLARRGDVRQAERRLAAETARIGVAMADLYPSISLAGSGQSSAAGVSGLGSPMALSYGLGPQLTWSFPKSDARARVRQARASAAAALANLDGTVVQALKETRQAMVVLEAERTRRTDLVETRDRRRRAFTIAQARNVAGGASFLELLQAEGDLIAAEQGVANSDQTVVDDEVAVFRALGTGPV